MKIEKISAKDFVQAALTQIIAPLAKRVKETGLDASLTLTGDYTAQAHCITFRVDGTSHVLRVQPVRLNRLNIVDADGSPDVNETFMSGRLGKIDVPFSELATRNATISLYELDWLLSQHVATLELDAVDAIAESAIESAQ